MSNKAYDWEIYFKWNQGREPHRLLLDVIERFPAEAPLHAIDLGCGDGTETVVLLSRGWHVLAVDGSDAGIERLWDKTSAESHSRLQAQVARYKDVVLPPADLVFAGYSLPFCRPHYFPTLWEKILNAVKPGGRFAGHFFGPRDSWANEPKMTSHTEEQIRSLLNGMEIEAFHERDEDGEAANGRKHWHVFSVIARKRDG